MNEIVTIYYDGHDDDVDSHDDDGHDSDIDNQ